MEFDAVSKYLLDAGPKEWLALCGRTTTASLTAVESELSTVTANADKFFRVEEQPPWLVNFEPFSSRDKKASQRVCLYSVLGLSKLELPVFTVVILLSRRADGPEWSGNFQVQLPSDAQPYLNFQFSVIRVWEIPPEILLKGGIATLALALISKIRKNEVVGVLRKVLARVDVEVPPEQQRNYRAAMSVLMGLCHGADFVKGLFKDFSEMRESSVAQMWLNEGREEGIVQGEAKGKHDALLTILKSRFGEINREVVNTLEGISDLHRLDQLIPFAVTDRTLKVFLNRLRG